MRMGDVHTDINGSMLTIMDRFMSMDIAERSKEKGL